MARPISQLDVTLEDRIELQRRFRAATAPQRESLRARIILLRAKGKKEQDIATELGVSMATVSKWSSRFELSGLDGLADKPGRGRKPSLPAGKMEQVLTKVTQPPRGATPLERTHHGERGGDFPGQRAPHLETE
jgi:uncharacterized protein YjcR